MSGYVKTFTIEEKMNKLMSFCVNDEELLEKYKTIWTKIEDLMNVLPFYDDRYIKTKIRTYGDKVYTNFRDFNMAENDTECELFTAISIDSLLVYENIYYL